MNSKLHTHKLLLLTPVLIFFVSILLILSPSITSAINQPTQPTQADLQIAERSVASISDSINKLFGSFNQSTPSNSSGQATQSPQQTSLLKTAISLYAQLLTKISQQLQPQTVYAAGGITKYARTQGGNWNANDTWSTTSGGSADTTVPTAEDNVILDSNSGNVTITNGSCRSLDASTYTGVLTQNASTTLTIGDGIAGAGNVALAFNDTGSMTYTITNPTNSYLYFASTSATTQTINFNSHNTPNVLIGAPAVAGNYQLTGTWGTSAVNASQATTLTKGTLDTNGQTCYWGRFNSSNSNTRSLILGTSIINLYNTGSSAVVWNIGITTGFTFSGSPSNLIFINTQTTYTLTTTATNGTITKNPNQTTYNQGASVTLTAVPNTGYQFSSYSGDTTGTTNPQTIIMNSNKSVTANFTVTTPTPPPPTTTYTIIASAGAGGTISPNSITTVNSGANQTYTITSNSGYQISSVTVDGASQGAISSYTFSNIIANHTISATFTVIVTPPSGTIHITTAWLANQGSAPYYLSQPDTTYVLQTDVTTNGAAFAVIARNITFDLNGHTITYNNSLPITIPNGSFEIGTGSSATGWNFTKVWWTAKTEQVHKIEN